MPKPTKLYISAELRALFDGLGAADRRADDATNPDGAPVEHTEEGEHAMPKATPQIDEPPLPAVQVTLVLTTHEDGVSADLKVATVDGYDGLEQAIGEALKAPAVALGAALATVLGGRVTAEGTEWRPLPLARIVAAGAPGRS